ncbi:MAG TPA: hypothetical protein VF765_10245 [Polyangiaceae bacterium]
MAADIILAFPSPVPPMRHQRSTLLQSGMATLREAGLYEAYVGVAPRAVREEIEGAVAGMWIPIETAVEHYLACDKLGLSSESVSKLGRATFDKSKGLLLGAATSLARGAGVSPLTLAPHLQRFWLRGYDGGGVQATRLGPKELRLDVIASPVLKSAYFRAALRGLCTALFELVTRRVYVHLDAARGPDTAVMLRVQWV